MNTMISVDIDDNVYLDGNVYIIVLIRYSSISYSCHICCAHMLYQDIILAKYQSLYLSIPTLFVEIFHIRYH